MVSLTFITMGLNMCMALEIWKENSGSYGPERIHCLITRDDVEVRFVTGNRTEPSVVWTYQLFRVDGAETTLATG